MIHGMFMGGYLRYSHNEQIGKMYYTEKVLTVARIEYCLSEKIVTDSSSAMVLLIRC